MVRICFIETWLNIQDKKETLQQLLSNALSTCAQSDDHLEFWIDYTNRNKRFTYMALKTIAALRKQYPSHQIDVVAAVVPVLSGFKTVHEMKANEDTLSELVTDVKYCPVITTNGLSDVAVIKELTRWIYHQCDVIFAYAYEGIPDFMNIEIRNIKRRGKRRGWRLYRIFDPDVAEIIKNYLNDQIEWRDTNILRADRDGCDIDSIAEEFDLTPEVARHILETHKNGILNRIRNIQDKREKKASRPAPKQLINPKGRSKMFRGVAKKDLLWF